MKTCPHCHIQVGGDTGYRPLCQNRLHGEQGSPWFPPTAPRIHRASLFYKIVAFVVLALTVVAGAIDFLLLDTAHLHFSLLILVGVAGCLCCGCFCAAATTVPGWCSTCCCSSRRSSCLPTGSPAIPAIVSTLWCRSCAV